MKKTRNVEKKMPETGKPVLELFSIKLNYSFFYLNIK